MILLKLRFVDKDSFNKYRHLMTLYEPFRLTRIRYQMRSLMETNCSVNVNHKHQSLEVYQHFPVISFIW